ncbi:MAG TPA: FAD-dependent oxidoreductase, partial [Candidatus Saccharibacteria bacterium]|nr:FAD-dependent oxidoreductase [Candidatus Saccharibacteria bacterium]
MNNRKKPSRTNYDLIVIGSGAAGSVAAQHAAQAGKKVCIVESGELGGDSPRFGVIPTKALLEAAKTLNVIQKSHQFGIRASAISFNYRSVQAFKEKAINSTGFNKEVDVFKNSNITVIRGRAHFINPWTISVGV